MTEQPCGCSIDHRCPEGARLHALWEASIEVIRDTVTPATEQACTEARHAYFGHVYGMLPTPAGLRP